MFCSRRRKGEGPKVTAQKRGRILGVPRLDRTVGRSSVSALREQDNFWASTQTKAKSVLSFRFPFLCVTILFLRLLFIASAQEMRILTHNMLVCNSKACNMHGFPLKITPMKIDTEESEFNPDFITHMLPKIDWAGVLSAASDVRGRLLLFFKI